MCSSGKSLYRTLSEVLPSEIAVRHNKAGLAVGVRCAVLAVEGETIRAGALLFEAGCDPLLGEGDADGPAAVSATRT